MTERKRVKPADEPATREDGIYLDPDLAAVRDREIAALADLPVPAPRGLLEDPEIDPELVKAREAEIQRGDKKLV